MQQMAWTDERLEERFDGIDRRFDEVDRRFDDAARQVDLRFDEVNRRIVEAAERTSYQLKESDRRMVEAKEQADHQFEEVNRKFDGIDGRFGAVELQLAELRQGMAALHGTLSRGSFGVIASLAGVIVAILLKGG
jgi:hypothetical protein